MNVSEPIEARYGREDVAVARSSMRFAFAAAVSELATQLHGSQSLKERRTDALLQQVESTLPADAEGAIQQLRELARASQALMSGGSVARDRTPLQALVGPRARLHADPRIVIKSKLGGSGIGSRRYGARRALRRACVENSAL